MWGGMVNADPMVIETNQELYDIKMSATTSTSGDVPPPHILE